MNILIKGVEELQAGDMLVFANIDNKLQATLITRNMPIKWCKVFKNPKLKNKYKREIKEY